MKHALNKGQPALTASQRRAIGVTSYKARERHPDEALPPQINKMAGTYTPPVWDTRARADDHQRIPSKGFT